MIVLFLCTQFKNCF